MVIGLIVLVGGGFMVLSGNKTTPVVEQVPTEDQVTMMKPEEIGLTLSASKDNRKVIMEVANTEGLSGLDYELSYTSKGDIPRGVIGHIDIKIAGKPITQEITLGTCSDVCHYDEDVSGISLTLKVTKIDGSAASIQKSLEI